MGNTMNLKIPRAAKGMKTTSTPVKQIPPVDLNFCQDQPALGGQHGTSPIPSSNRNLPTPSMSATAVQAPKHILYVAGTSAKSRFYFGEV